MAKRLRCKECRSTQGLTVISYTPPGSFSSSDAKLFGGEALVVYECGSCLATNTDSTAAMSESDLERYGFDGY